MDTTKYRKQAALWLANQLTRPVHEKDENTVVHTKESIRERFGDHDLTKIEAYIELYRPLTWREKSRRGKNLAIEMVEATRTTYKFQPQQFRDSPTDLQNLIGTNQYHWIHKVLIALVDHQKDDVKILSDINIASTERDSQESMRDPSNIFLNGQEFEIEDIDLLLKAWLHQGGDLEDLEGTPSYLSLD